MFLMMMIKKFKRLLLSVWLLTLPVGVYAGVITDTCTAGGAIISSEPYSATTNIDISPMFTFSDHYSVSLRTSWSGRMWCGIGELLDDVYYYSPIQGAPDGTYIGFFNAATGDMTTFHVTVEPEKSYEGVNGLPGSHSLGYQVNYTVTFTLVESAPSGSTLITTENNMVTIGAIASSGQKRSDSAAYEVWSSNNWGKKRWLTYQNLNITFNITNTTCSTQNQTVNLPETSIDAIRHGRAARKPFILEFQCSGTINNLATRNVQSWLYSADRVGDIGQGYVLRNPQSTAKDIGIVLTDYFGRPVKLSDSMASANNADIILEIKKGKVFQTKPDEAYVFATYAIYGEDPKPGSITATAVVVINYD
ncbi:fimbrial protein [Vibrio cincinnatiensis]|uniref:fimbrial protein n=1 Tax=Vibrio cincinnatiensis TaxID=675 RepID=UPI001EDD1CF4|nr:fimbrial protein [Vibrio cincinnatiensis]MCG3728582.1 adhesin [Vibrio cincinnatiensis]